MDRFKVFPDMVLWVEPDAVEVTMAKKVVKGIEKARQPPEERGLRAAGRAARNVYVRYYSDQGEAEAEMQSMGCHPHGVAIMGPKAMHITIKVEGMDSRAANIVKQDMLSIGGEAAASRGIIDNSIAETDVILMGTAKQMDLLAGKMAVQPFDLPVLGKEISALMRNVAPRTYKMRCGSSTFDIGKRTYIMGVLNVTPDSFSDGGRFLDPEVAAQHAVRMEKEGADLIDIGAESSRPGSDPIPLSEERGRLLPALKRVIEDVKVPISVDTYKEAVAKEALDMGASMINDISGLRFSKGMARLAAKHDVPVVIMHMQGMPKSMQKDPRYKDPLGDVVHFFRERVAYATWNGISPERIILDPGIGFGKKLEHNLAILRRFREFTGLGFPLMVGTSRKSFLGHILDLDVDGRMEGTIASNVIAASRGCDFLRVHDVAEHVKALRVVDAILDK